MLTFHTLSFAVNIQNQETHPLRGCLHHQTQIITLVKINELFPFFVHNFETSLANFNSVVLIMLNKHAHFISRRGES